MRARPKRRTRCTTCGRSLPDYETIRCGSPEEGYRELCTGCFNAEIAEAEGLDRFEHAEFTPMEFTDCAGNAHTFHFQARLFGPGVSLDAFEVRGGRPAGYQFQVIDEPETDLLVLLARLIEKIRRALSIKHLELGEFGLQVADRVVRGRLDWDEAAGGQVPLLVIDGREFTWDEFGRMMMTFEGWNFKLEIKDKSEEL